MTLFPRQFEKEHGIDTSPEAVDSRIPNTVDRTRETTIGILLGGKSADNIFNLPENHVPTPIGSFEEAYSYYGLANDNSAHTAIAA